LSIYITALRHLTFSQVELVKTSSKWPTVHLSLSFVKIPKFLGGATLQTCRFIAPLDKHIVAAGRVQANTRIPRVDRRCRYCDPYNLECRVPRHSSIANLADKPFDLHGPELVFNDELIGCHLQVCFLVSKSMINVPARQLISCIADPLFSFLPSIPAIKQLFNLTNALIWSLFTMAQSSGHENKMDSEKTVQRNPHPDFKKVEASRPSWREDASWTYTKTRNPDWKLGNGSNDGGECLKTNHIQIDPYAEGRPATFNYKLLISAIIPRPIGFVSTRSKDGKHYRTCRYKLQKILKEARLLSLKLPGLTNSAR
jgi:hypothetical protein